MFPDMRNKSIYTESTSAPRTHRHHKIAHVLGDQRVARAQRLHELEVLVAR